VFECWFFKCLDELVGGNRLEKRLGFRQHPESGCRLPLWWTHNHAVKSKGWERKGKRTSTRKRTPCLGWVAAGCGHYLLFTLDFIGFGEESSVCASRLRPPPYGVRIEVGARLRLTGIGNIRRASQSHRTWVGWHIVQLFFKVRCLARRSVALSEVAREVSGPLDSSIESCTWRNSP
jgi:hypothetical protein